MDNLNQQHQAGGTTNAAALGAGEFLLIAHETLRPVIRVTKSRTVTIMDDATQDELIHAFIAQDHLVRNWNDLRPLIMPALEKRGIRREQLTALGPLGGGGGASYGGAG